MKLQNGKHLSFPFRVGDDGRMATVRTLDEHVRDELVQLHADGPDTERDGEQARQLHVRGLAGRLMCVSLRRSLMLRLR